LEAKILAALRAPGRTDGVRKIAQRLGVDAGTVQRISRAFEGASAAKITQLPRAAWRLENAFGTVIESVG